MVTSKSFIGGCFVCVDIPRIQQPWCQTLEKSSDGLNPHESHHLRKAALILTESKPAQSFQNCPTESQDCTENWWKPAVTTENYQELLLCGNGDQGGRFLWAGHSPGRYLESLRDIEVGTLGGLMPMASMIDLRNSHRASLWYSANAGCCRITGNQPNRGTIWIFYHGTSNCFRAMHWNRRWCGF